MDKAKIHVLDDKDNVSRTIEVMFNPTELTNSISAKWQGEKGTMQFRGTDFANLTLNLFFDSYEEGVDVRENHNTREGRTVFGTNRLSELAVPSEGGKVGKKPPVCLFSWGTFFFKGFIEKVDQKFIMFLPNGLPVRARVTIVMKNIQGIKGVLKLNGLEACRKFRLVKEGDRLDLVTAEELKDANKWRIIASANKIADPLNFPTHEDIGKFLIIPEIPDEV
jgi:hypothetical protein